MLIPRFAARVVRHLANHMFSFKTLLFVAMEKLSVSAHVVCFFSALVSRLGARIIACPCESCLADGLLLVVRVHQQAPFVLKYKRDAETEANQLIADTSKGKSGATLKPVVLESITTDAEWKDAKRKHAHLVVVCAKTADMSELRQVCVRM
jgi:hypothetical protein